MEVSPHPHPPEEPRRTKAEVLWIIEDSRARLEELLDSLSEDRLTIPSPDGGWSIKEHLSHLVVWEEGIAALLRRQPRYLAMGIEEAVLNGATEVEVNAIMHMRCKECSLEEVRADFDRVHQDFLESMQELSDEELYRPYEYFQPDEPGEDSGHPILKWILGNTSEHFEEHARWIRENFVQG